MNLTDQERAAMVRDVTRLKGEYQRMVVITKTAKDLPEHVAYFERMAINYEALAEALAERKPFKAVA